MTTPLISVVIPSYNRGELIADTIGSVLAQDFQDFEILVVDDGSTDNTADVVRNIDDSRVRYIWQSNSGANTARNRGINEARGKYVALLDADDRFLESHLSTCLCALQSFPDHIIYGRIIVDRGNGQSFTKPPRAIKPGEHMSEYLMCTQGFVQTSTLFLSTTVGRAVGYLEGLKNGQDIDFAIRLYAEGHHFHMIDEPTVVWRDHADPKRISARSDPQARLVWLETIRPLITEKAWHGYRGWFVAKAFWQAGQRGQAIRLYLQAMQHRAYDFKLGLKIGAQILLGSLYRSATRAYLAAKG